MSNAMDQRAVDNKLALQLAAAGLSHHAINAVIRGRVIEQPADLYTVPDDELLSLKSLGPGALKEIRAAFPFNCAHLYGCLDSRLDGTPVRIERPLEPHEYVEFVEEGEPHDWLWISTPRGTTFVRADRVRAA